MARPRKSDLPPRLETGGQIELPANEALANQLKFTFYDEDEQQISTSEEVDEEYQKLIYSEADPDTGVGRFREEDDPLAPVRVTRYSLENPAAKVVSVDDLSVAFRKHGPLRGITSDRITDKASLIALLGFSLPLNEMDLPIFFYRPDMVDERLIKETLEGVEKRVEGAEKALDSVADMLKAAQVYLNYSEGFPTLPNGMPFWAQFVFEPKAAAHSFELYLELGGARNLINVTAYSMEELLEYSNMFYWNYRAKAFDLYRVANHQKLKLQRMLSTEDDHYNIAQNLIRKVMEYMNSIDLDEENMAPDKAVAMLEKLVKIQRISTGLPASGESKENNASRQVTPVNVIMQQIGTQDRREIKADEPELDLLQDPEAFDLAQDLIIRLQKDGD